jgi:hypothetical protein
MAHATRSIDFVSLSPRNAEFEQRLIALRRKEDLEIDQEAGGAAAESGLRVPRAAVAG